MPTRKIPAFSRARSPEQIEARQSAILAAAYDLLKEKGLENVSLGDIATRAGTVKSNLYRYFESREHIYLLVLQRHGVQWAADVQAALHRLRGRGTPAGVARAVTATFLKHGDYSRMVGVFNPVLEHALTPALVLNFRIGFLARRQLLAAAMAQALPALSEESALDLTIPIFAHVGGIWPLCQISADTRQLLSAPEHAHLVIDFETEMSRFLQTLITGALSKDSQPSRAPKG